MRENLYKQAYARRLVLWDVRKSLRECVKQQWAAQVPFAPVGRENGTG